MAKHERKIGGTRPFVRRRRRLAVWLAAAALATPAIASAADTPMTSVTDIIGARNYWAAGYTGKGVDIAVIDTGVADVIGLDTGKLMHAPDLSFDSQSATLYQRDGYGHGTHMASIAAGRDGAEETPSAYLASTKFLGVAPDARIVNVKAGDAAGGVDITQVIAAVDWVVEHRRDPGMNIRVLLLAYGTDTTQPYDSEPLTDALEQAWKAGITVVVAAGNSGGTAANTGTIGLLNPARAPFLIAVGAADTKGTTSSSDDTVAGYSSQGGGTGAYVRDPDVVAPGRTILGLRVPGSYVDATYGAGAVVGGRYFRGSGTSQAAAVVAGAMALVQQQRPAATPNQIKALLKSTSTPLSGVAAKAQGSGEINLARALAGATPAGAQTWQATRGDGSIRDSRGSYILTFGGVALNNDNDIFGDYFAPATAASLRRAGTIWVGGQWRGIQLVGDGRAGALTALGTSVTWTGRSWFGRSWTDFAWTGRSWAGRSWSGDSWAGRGWASTTWTDQSFAAAGWN